MINTYIITGFLGAGKTTFLNHFLKYHSAENNLVIENEFGKVNIDAKLITEKIYQIIELTSGCICCSLDNELIEVLAKIIHSENKPCNVFIETTGIADAGNIIGMIKSPEIEKHFCLKHTICIVDAENIEDRLAETFEAGKQLSVSDIVVINKLNNVAEHYGKKVKGVVKEINPLATIFKSYDGTIDLSEFARAPNCDDFVVPKATIDITKKTEHKINTVLFETKELLDFEKLVYALHVNFTLYPHQLFRLKGFVRTNRDNNTYLVQSTGKFLSFVPMKLEDSMIKDSSILVFIGLQLKTETITRILRPSIINHKVIRKVNLVNHDTTNL
jgi:G3E family GTPase